MPTVELRAPDLRSANPDDNRTPRPELRPQPESGLRHDWTRAEARALYEAPFNDLLFQAQTVHRRSFDPNAVQMSRLLSIKTGGCAEDCGYCSQSAHHASGLAATKLMAVNRV